MEAPHVAFSISHRKWAARAAPDWSRLLDNREGRNKSTTGFPSKTKPVHCLPLHAEHTAWKAHAPTVLAAHCVGMERPCHASSVPVIKLRVGGGVPTIGGRPSDSSYGGGCTAF